jgi:hypothetical protein
VERGTVCGYRCEGAKVQITIEYLGKELGEVEGVGREKGRGERKRDIN